MLRNVSAYIHDIESLVVQRLGIYCADLSTSMTFGTGVDQNILNSFLEGAKAGAHWGRHNGKKQYGR